MDRNSKDRRGSDRKGTTAIVASEEELMLITEESELNLAGDEMTWVIDPEPDILLILHSRRSRLCSDGE